MWSRRRKILLVLLIGFCLWLIGSVWYLNRAVPVFLGYAAKSLCSGVFISQRSPEAVFQDDIAPMIFFSPMVRLETDSHRKTVSVDLAGWFRRKAFFRKGCGCTLALGNGDNIPFRQPKEPLSSELNISPDKFWPIGSRGPADPLPGAIDRKRLAGVLDAAFIGSTSEKSGTTRAVVVVYDGKMIAERYAPGFHKDMALPGWSISKSVTNALVGILVNKQWLSLKGPAPVPEWRRPDDPRGTITLDQLLRMSSGLKFDEVYTPPSDVTQMFFESYDFAAFAAGMPIESKPETEWHYSSGTTNIIAAMVRRAVEKKYGSTHHFAHQELFDKLRIHSAVMELDPSGTFVGSSYMFATARDWARFGLLYLQDGVWQGERILPTGWVDYSRTPTPQAPQGKYGAHFWLNAGDPVSPSDRLWPRLPRDMFAAWGFQGQYLIIIPSRKIVLVRLGLDLKSVSWDLQFFVSEVLAAIHYPE